MSRGRIKLNCFWQLILTAAADRRQPGARETKRVAAYIYKPRLVEIEFEKLNYKSEIIQFDFHRLAFATRGGSGFLARVAHHGKLNLTFAETHRFTV